MKNISLNYNKVPGSIRYSWPLIWNGIEEIENQLLFHVLNHNWTSLDMHSKHIGRVPRSLGLYIIVSKLENIIPKYETNNNGNNDSFLSKTNLNCVLYVGMGTLQDRYKNHIESSDSEKMYNAINIYNPKYYYIETKEIKIHQYIDKLEKYKMTKLYESILIDFFGPAVNEIAGEDINSILNYDQNKSIEVNLVNNS